MTSDMAAKEPRKYKILIVEDERQLAEITRMSFPSDRFLALACHSGGDALKEAAANRPDLIVLDLIMPGGIDGWEVLRRLKSDPKSASIPVVVCTGKEDPGDVDKAFQFGAQAYVMKPIHFGLLIKKVAAILDIEELLKE